MSLLLTLFGAALQKLVDDLDDASAELMLADDDEAVKMQVRKQSQSHVGHTTHAYATCTGSCWILPGGHCRIALCQAAVQL